MTRTEFIRRRDFGQIAPETPVRTVIFWFAGRAHEWEEIFVPARYETIAQQEAAFRNAMGGVCQFADTFRPEATVPAHRWQA